MEGLIVNKEVLRQVGAFATFFVLFCLGTVLWRSIVKRNKSLEEAGGNFKALILRKVTIPGYFLLGCLTFWGFSSYLNYKTVNPSVYIFAYFLIQIAVFWFLGEIVFISILRYYSKVNDGQEFPSIFRQILKSLAYLIIFLSFLSNSYNLDITPLLTTSAVFTMVLGLALQDVLGNLFSGLSVHFSPPFKLGDWIEINGYSGKVMESNWRATTLKLPSGALVILPNNQIARKEIVNFSDETGVRFQEFSIGLSYSVSPERVRRVLSGACRQVEEIFSRPSPAILMKDYQDYSIKYTVRYWIDNQTNPDRVNNKLASRVWYRLKREGISVPFPIQDIYVHQEKDDHRKVIEHRLNLISRIDFLKGLDKTLKSYIAERLEESWFETGEVIVSEGAFDTDFFILDRGKVSVHIKDAGKKSVAELSPGEFFGEMSLLTGERRGASVIAVTETRLLKLNRDAMGHLLAENNELADKLSSVLAERNVKNAEVIENRSLYSRKVMAAQKGDSSPASKAAILQKIRNFFKL